MKKVQCVAGELLLWHDQLEACEPTKAVAVGHRRMIPTF